MQLAYFYQKPFTLFECAIGKALSSKPIPGLIVKLRNFALLVTFAVLGISVFEVVRTSGEGTILPSTDWRVWAWIYTCVLGGFLSLVATFML